MSPRARHAVTDFSQLASDYGGTLYLTDLLCHGWNAWPPTLRSQYPGLCDWRGVSDLKKKLQSLSQAAPDSAVRLASRTVSIMQCAARLMFGPCRNVLVTDLTWPSYARILRQEQCTSACHITTIQIRKTILYQRPSGADVVELIARKFESSQCDGLFLPLVDNLGIRLPIRRIVERIRAENELRFVVVDGAQALHHLPLNLASNYCDLLIAGTHKWLQAFVPLGVCFFGHPRSCDYIRGSLDRLVKSGAVCDPLLRFSEELYCKKLNATGETVSITPLVAASAAAEDALRSANVTHNGVESNRLTICGVAANRGWSVLSPGGDLASRIVLLRSTQPHVRSAPPDSIQRRFLNANVAVTTYGDGIVRASVPMVCISCPQIESLEKAFSG